jgi:hypothetical protein
VTLTIIDHEDGARKDLWNVGFKLNVDTVDRPWRIAVYLFVVNASNLTKCGVS